MTTRIGRLMAGAGMAALVAGFAGYGSTNLEAATATASFSVTANVTANCTIAAGSLGFGSYDAVVANAASPLDQTSTLTVACTKGTNAAVSLDLGAHASGSALGMQSGSTATEFLSYELYTTAARSTTCIGTRHSRPFGEMERQEQARTPITILPTTKMLT
jgi:spore coat protein U-like protein